MLVVGDAAPSFRAQPVFGLPLDVEDQTQRYPLVICFVSSLGSPLTRQTLARLQDRFADFDVEGIAVVAVTRSDLDVARDFVPRHHVLYRVFSDPDGDLYERFGVVGGDWKAAIKALSPRSVKRSMQALSLGVGKPERGSAQVPAEFVVAPGGVISYARYGASMTDLVEIDDLVRAAREALA